MLAKRSTFHFAVNGSYGMYREKDAVSRWQ